MNDLDPHRFALRQADQAREARDQVMEELELVKEQLAPFPTSSETLRLALGCLAAAVVALLLLH
jgi:hypothetical protein